MFSWNACETSSMLNWETPTFEIYDMNADLPPSGEENKDPVKVQITNETNNFEVIKTEKDLTDNQTFIIGRNQENFFYVNDRYLSGKHCSISFQNWWRNQQEWVQTYSVLTRTKLPFELCRYIAQFLKEPRRITLKDLNSSNGTRIVLKPGSLTPLKNEQIFRLAETLEMIVGDVKEIRGRTIKDIQKQLDYSNETIPPRVYADLINWNQETDIVVFVASVKFKLVKDKDSTNITSEYRFATNKPEKSLKLGKAHLMDVSLGFADVDNIQCEVVFKDGKWNFCEVQHLEAKNRSCLCLEKETEYNFKESTEVMIGKSLMRVDVSLTKA